MSETGQDKIMFRPQRGGLRQAMSESLPVDGWDGLVRHLSSLGYEGAVTVEKYGDGIDRRIGWDTHLVCVNGLPAGYTSGPISQKGK